MPPPPLRPRLMSPLLGAALWGSLALLFFSASLGVYAVKQEEYPLAHVFWWTGAEWLFYGAVSPFVFQVLRRLPMDGPGLRRSLPTLFLTWFVFHGLVWLVYVLMERGCMFGGFADNEMMQKMSFPRMYAMYLLKKSGITIMVMIGMVVVEHVADLYHVARERERRAAQLQADLAQSRLQALRGQLQPHFLFNTLNTIAALVHRDPDGAERVTSLLGDLLRETLLGHGDAEIPLRDEVAFLERYVEIQQTRFADRLTVDLAIDPSLHDAMVPSLILQPLVENAIRHGIEPRAAPGRVTVTGRRDGDHLILTVHDDGVGIRADGCNGHGTEGCGVGLRNTKLRLKELYGEERQRFAIGPAEGGGTIATVTLPWNTGKGEHHA